MDTARNHDAARILQAQQHRIRYSDFVESGTFIFPQSGIAFMLVAAQEFPENPEEAGLFERIKTFLQIHRNSFILLLASLHRKKEWEILSTVQQRFFGGNLRILPVHNNAEMVKGMLTIAKATSKPHVVTVRDRMSLARAHVIERSPVWEMLRDIRRSGRFELPGERPAERLQAFLNANACPTAGATWGKRFNGSTPPAPEQLSPQPTCPVSLL
ncbi:protein SPO16 homolog isoform X2 [Anguilla rostrata]|uniref:protein SPO16 homolog isoform X2 n=1 Tax=Anguilla rostrata TaxID=7938 RepID=UPI0030D062EF